MAASRRVARARTVPTWCIGGKSFQLRVLDGATGQEGCKETVRPWDEPVPRRMAYSRASKKPVLRFFRTRFQGNAVPFIATYTPAGSTWANDSALPRLKSPSELPK